MKTIHLDYFGMPGSGTSTEQPKQSKGHMFFLDGYEWLTAGGEVYRAPLSSPIGLDGFRMGARWEFPAWQIESRQKGRVYPFSVDVEFAVLV